jgi:hypothetical protein
VRGTPGFGNLDEIAFRSPRGLPQQRSRDGDVVVPDKAMHHLAWRIIDPAQAVRELNPRIDVDPVKQLTKHVLEYQDVIVIEAARGLDEEGAYAPQGVGTPRRGAVPDYILQLWNERVHGHPMHHSGTPRPTRE